MTQTYIEWVEVWEATHGLLQQSNRIQLRKAWWILHILEKKQQLLRDIDDILIAKTANTALPAAGLQHRAQ